MAAFGTLRLGLGWTRGGGSPVLDLTDIFGEGDDGALYGLPFKSGVDLYQERASPTTLAEIGDPVGTIIDKSGNGRHRIAVSDAARPTLQQDSNGHCYLSYDGVDDQTKSASTYSIGTQYLLAVMENNDSFFTFATAADNDNHHRLQSSISYGGFAYARFGASGQGISNSYTVGFLGSMPEDEFAIISSMLRATVYDCSVNSGTKSTKTTAWDGTAIGGCYIGQSSLSTCKDYGSLVLKRDVLDTERASIESRIATYYRHSIFPYEFDVFIIGGQSNAIGRATADGDTPVSGSYQTATGGGVLNASVPLNHPDDDAGDVGPDVAFATAYLAANPGRNVLFVPVAYGSTRFSNGGWRKGGTHYNRLVDEANDAIALNSGATLKGLIMALGENDTITGGGSGVATFKTDMDTFIADVRSDITGAANLPVVWAGMSQDWVDSNPGYQDYQDVIAAVGSRNTNAAFASSTSPTKATSEVGDNVHFDRPGVYTMGQRWYDAWLVASS